MKINKLSISNYLGIGQFDAEINSKVMLVTGFNGAGKSSLAEAVRHALTSEFERVEFKKDLGALLHNGAKAGHVLLETTHGEYGAILPSGDITGDHAQLSWALSLCLDPNVFARLNSGARRTMLFKLMGVKITGSEINKRLIAHGVSEADAALINPYLSGGFEAANKQAAEMARDSKTAWRVLTGETYGEKKAETWSLIIPDAPETCVDSDTLARIDIEVEGLSAALGRMQESRKTAEASASLASTRDSQIATLRTHASTFAAIQDKLNRDEIALADLAKKIAAADNLIENGEGMPCPNCGDFLSVNSDGKIVSCEKIDNLEDVKSGAAELRAAHGLLYAQVTKGKGELGAANNAAQQLNALENEPYAKPMNFDALNFEIDALNETLENKRKERANLRADFDKLQASLAANNLAKTKMTQAANYHRDVKTWDFIAKLLAPDGIQAEMLVEAIAPFNAKLAALSDSAGWGNVEVSDDMSIHVDGLPYSLRSESERWRADAIIATAIAQISGANIVMLDRFDVLDIVSRKPLFTWLEKIELDMVIMLGTAKEATSNAPAFISPFWI